jgi:hypothetical protein
MIRFLHSVLTMEAASQVGVTSTEMLAFIYWLSSMKIVRLFSSESYDRGIKLTNSSKSAHSA